MLAQEHLTTPAPVYELPAWSLLHGSPTKRGTQVLLYAHHPNWLLGICLAHFSTLTIQVDSCMCVLRYAA